MIEMVIAAHGGFGKELLNSVSLVVGPVDKCAAWSLNPGDNIERTGLQLKELLDEMTMRKEGLSLRISGEGLRPICHLNTPEIKTLK